MPGQRFTGFQISFQLQICQSSEYDMVISMGGLHMLLNVPEIALIMPPYA